MILKNRKSLTNMTTDMIPIGVVQPYIGLIAPSGYLLLNGQQVSQKRYPELYNLCGSLFNNGQTPDTGMFYLPDLRGRAIVGLNSGDTEFDTIGKRYGSKTHILTINQLPTHTHIQNAHSHTMNGASGAGTWRNMFAAGNNAGVETMAVHSVTATNQNTGSDEAHNNIQPSIAFSYIVKAEMITAVLESNIYDGLDSDSTTKALSANQGRVLNERILYEPLSITCNLSELQQQIDNLPKILMNDVTIQVNPGTITNNILLKGFSGSGRIQISGATSATNTHNILSFTINDCSNTRIGVTGFNATTTTDTSFLSSMVNCPVVWTYCRSVGGASSTSSNYGIWGSWSMWVYVNVCEISNKNGAFIISGGKMLSQSTTGSENNSVYWAENGGILCKRSGSSATGTTINFTASAGIVVNNTSGVILN